MREFFMKRGRCCWLAGVVAVFGILCASFIAHGANEKQSKEPVAAEEELPPVGWADVVGNYLTFREESWPMILPASEGEVFGSWDSIIANIGKRIVCGWFWYFQGSQVRLEKGALPGQGKLAPVEVVIYEDIYNSRVVVLGMAEGEKPREFYSEKTIPLLSSLDEGFPPEAEIAMRRIAVRFTALPHNYSPPAAALLKAETSLLNTETLFPLMRMMGGEYSTNKIWLELEHVEQEQINTVGLTVHIPVGTFSNVDVFYNTNLLDSAACELVCASQAVNAEGILSLSFGTTNVGMGFYRATNAEEDSDGDGLLDGRERWLYLTRPDLADTDGDGDSDGREVEFGTDPLDSLDYFGVVINAIQPYPPAPGVENYREWVELFNCGRDAVSLDGFRLETARPAGWTNVFTFPSGVTLDPGDFLVVGNSSNGNFGADLLLPNSTYTPPSVFGLRLLPPASARVADAVFYGYTNDFDFSLEGFGSELPILRPAQGGVIRRTWIGFDTDHAGDWIQVEGALWPPHLQGEHLDLDGDGLSNAEELENGVFPLDGGTQLTVTDTDGDGMSDFDEINHEWNQVPAPLNPNDVDTDGDAFPWSELSLPEGNDANEIANGSNPTVYDTDGDGIPDGWEIAGGLDPNSPDSDNDSDSDGDEDTDEDGIPNGVEVAQLSNPFPPFGAASRTPNNYLMLYNGGAFTCRSEGDIGYGTILTYDVVATSNCPPFLVEIREGGGEAEAYSVECCTVCGLIRAYEENVTGQTVRVRVYAVEPQGQTAFQFSVIDGLTTWKDENPESLGADISICHGGIENDLERPELPEVDEESVGFNIANKTAHPDAQRKQLLIQPPTDPFDAITGVVLTYDPKLLLYDAAEEGNIIASGSIIPVESLSTNIYAEGITVSGGMRDSWVETTPYEVELPDRVAVTILQASLGDPGILPYKPWHTNAPRNALQLLQTQPTAWDGLMQLNLTGADVFSSPSGGTPMTLPLTFTNQLLASTVYLETDSAGGGLATFHVVGLEDCIAKRELQVLGVNATLDGLAEADEESPGAFIADRSAHPNASRTQLTLEAITPTNPPGDCTLTWDPQYLSIFTSPAGTNQIQFNGHDNVFHYYPFTNQTFYIEGKTSGVSTITFSSGGLSDVISVTIIRVDLEIYKPKVIDTAETMIPDADEMSLGSVAFVNLDNDDDDALFDYGGSSTNDAVVAGGDDELVKVKIKIQPNTIPVGHIQLSAPLGAAHIAVWTNNEKVASGAFSFGTPLVVPGDLEAEGDSLVKTLWVEGILAHTAQRETKIKAQYTRGALTCFDEAALTIIGVDHIAWQGQGNSLNDDNNLNDDPNWPVGLAPGALRVFPDARVVSGAVEADPRDKVTADVKLTVAAPSEIKVYLKSFDVDDPTADVAPVDDETAGSDNRGNTPAQAGQFTGESGGVLELTFSANIQSNTCEFQTTMQPGDNFRIVANGDKDFLLKLENNDAVQNVGASPAETNANKQRICNQSVTGTPEEREIQQVSHYASEVLTVWRFLHVEVDSMAAPPTTGAEKNTVDGTLTGIIGNGTVAQRVSLDINLCTGLTPQDNSDNLDGTGNGRFENGWIQVGSTQTSGLLGNGNTYVRKDGGIDIPALVSKGGQPDVSGSIVEWSGSTFTLNVSSGTLSTNYNGGTLNVAGISTTISIASTNTGANIVNVTASPTIPFVLHDDIVGDVPEPDVAGMEDVWGVAFVNPVFDTGNNTVDAVFRKNSNYINSPQSYSDHLYESRGASFTNCETYWSVQVKNGYQTDNYYYDPSIGQGGDNDSDSEGTWRGVGDPATLGALLLEESIRDWIATPVIQGGAGGVDPDTAGTPGRQLRRQEIVNHEVGHLFRLWHPEGGVMAPSANRTSSHFGVVSIDKIRKKQKPGDCP